VLTP